MKIVRQIIKILVSLIIGAAFGLLLSGAAIVIFTDTTATEFIDMLRTIDLSKGVVAALCGVASLLLSVPLLIIIHEGGHLAAGLLSGYRFVSFRIFSLTFVKVEGKIKVKHFSISGTGGQCLLSPPDLPLEKIPTWWYNMGGVAANVAVFVAVVPLLFLDLHPLAMEFIAIFLLADGIIIITNGIPMTIGGMGNDARNALMLRKNLTARRGLVMQLRSNALIQAGVRPKDMPGRWFDVPDNIDYRNALETSLPLMHASRLVDMSLTDDAYSEFSRLYSHKDEIMGLFVKEIACELVYCSLLTGREAEAKTLLDKELTRYIEAYRKTMSSKERILCAICLYMHHDRAKAEAILDNLRRSRDSYLLQGEVKSDIHLMETMLHGQ